MRVISVKTTRRLGLVRRAGDSQEVTVVRLRLKRMGRRHRPFYRLAAVDSRKARDSRVIEELGHYDPLQKDEAKQVLLNNERVSYWLSVGAQPSDTVRGLIKRSAATEQK